MSVQSILRKLWAINGRCLESPIRELFWSVLIRSVRHCSYPNTCIRCDDILDIHVKFRRISTDNLRHDLPPLYRQRITRYMGNAFVILMWRANRQQSLWNPFQYQQVLRSPCSADVMHETLQTRHSLSCVCLLCMKPIKVTHNEDREVWGSHVEYEDGYLLGCWAVQSGR
jgi:hypothetical protein